jgi:DNA polymerase-3 subunit alpha
MLSVPASAPSATAELDLGEEGRFYPSDEALQAWRECAEKGEVALIY